MKNGVSTSEFYMCLGSIIFLIVAQYIKMEIPPDLKNALITIILGYLGSRTIVKIKDGGNGVEKG